VRPRRGTRGSLDEVDAGVEPVALVAAEEEGTILHDRPAGRCAELVLAQLRLGQLLDDAAVAVTGAVEVVRRVEAVVPVVLERRAREQVGARLGDDADLTAGARPELGRVVVRLDAELLHVLEARLQLEGRGDLTVDVAGGGVDDRRAFDAVVADHVLLVGTAAETDVVPGAGAGVQRAGCLQHQLRHLSAVDRQVVDFALGHVDTDASRAEIHRRRVALDRDGFRDAGGLEGQVERELLRCGQLHAGVLDRGEALVSDFDRVDGRPQAGQDVAAVGVGDDHALFAGPLVARDDGRARHGRTRGIDDGAAEAAVAVGEDDG
jgi:hypothetical protein